MNNPVTKNFVKAGLTASAGLVTTTAAHAQEALKDWQLWHQPAASPGMEEIISFDILTFWIITPITLFVVALLAYVMIKFRASANPVPSKTTHHAGLEVAWTLGPVLILLILAIPSFKLLTLQFNPPEEPSITIKATGYQWYWGYEYQGDKEVSFEARPVGSEVIAGSKEAALKEREDAGKTDLKTYPRLLAVDNEVVVPVGKVVRVLVTAGDVIHDWAMPAFGIKMDGIPGRLNEVYFQPMKEGLYYGQCSELCGKYHAYMPIAVRVVSEAQYATWLAKAGDDIGAAGKDLMASIEKNKNIKVASKRVHKN